MRSEEVGRLGKAIEEANEEALLLFKESLSDFPISMQYAIALKFKEGLDELVAELGNGYKAEVVRMFGLFMEEHIQKEALDKNDD